MIFFLGGPPPIAEPLVHNRHSHVRSWENTEYESCIQAGHDGKLRRPFSSCISEKLEYDVVIFILLGPVAVDRPDET